MTYDSTSPPVRVFDIVSRRPEPEPGPPAAAAARPSRRFSVHPLVPLGWPPYVLPVDGSWRPPRRRIAVRRRERRR